MSKPNWPISGADGTPHTATTGAAVVDLGSTAAIATDVMIDNPGPSDVYVKAGPTGAVAATVASVRVPANSLQPFAKGQGNRYLSAFVPSGTQAIVIHVGDGA